MLCLSTALLTIKAKHSMGSAVIQHVVCSAQLLLLLAVVLTGCVGRELPTATAPDAFESTPSKLAPDLIATEQEGTAAVAVAAAAAASAQAQLPVDSPGYNPQPPSTKQRLIFVHHSTGQNWLADDNGGLGKALMRNNYVVSDTNYGWGPDGIGDRTDIGNWYEWFVGSSASTYLGALYRETAQNCDYSCLSGTGAAAVNSIVLFKSCFPNSALQDPLAPVPPIATNPLKGQGSDSPHHTVANAKGTYNALLGYFASRQDKLFVAIAAPPLSDETWAANARAFNQWLYLEWLRCYPYKNVAVFDFYNVLTSSDAHHMYDVATGTITHVIDTTHNTTAYPSDDDHPSQDGNTKATDEFLPLVNIFYNCWKGSGACPNPISGANSAPCPPIKLTATTEPDGLNLTWVDASVDENRYVVMRKPGAAAAWARLATLSVNPPEVAARGSLVSYLDAPADTSDADPTPYGYKVRACNAYGCSTATAEAFVPLAATLTASADSDTLTVSGTVQGNTAPGNRQNRFLIHRKTGACDADGASDADWAVAANVAARAGGGKVQWTDAGAPGTPLQAGGVYSYRALALAVRSDSKGVSGYSDCVEVSL